VAIMRSRTRCPFLAFFIGIGWFPISPDPYLHAAPKVTCVPWRRGALARTC
jgi:hypothetical protein